MGGPAPAGRRRPPAGARRRSRGGTHGQQRLRRRRGAAARARGMLTRPRSELVVVDVDELPRLPAAIGTSGPGWPSSTATSRGRSTTRRKPRPRPSKATTSCGRQRPGSPASRPGRVETSSAAHHAYLTSADGLARAGHIADVLGCSLALADMELVLGRLSDAERTLANALTPGRTTPCGRGTGHARDSRHAGGSQPLGLAPQRPRLLGRVPSSRRRARGNREGCHSIPTAGGSPWPASGRRRATSLPRSS